MPRPTRLKAQSKTHSRSTQRPLDRRDELSSPVIAPGDKHAQLLHFQRTVGNKAVTRLLGRTGNAPGDGPIVQRAVGFEFETSWQVHGRRNQGFPKYTKLYTDTTNGFSMETDVPNAGESDIEFVVNPPFEESPAGANRLPQTMQALETFFGNMSQFVGQRRVSGRRLAPFLNTGLKHVTLVPGNHMAATPQSTVGVRLERLVDLLDEMRRPGGDAKQELIGSSPDFHAGKFDQYVTGAQNARDQNRPGYVPSRQMQGLLTAILQYMLRGALPPGVQPTDSPNELYRHAFKYVKNVAAFMPRTNFGGLFDLLPNAEKNYYKAHPNHWADFVLGAAGGLAGASNVIERGIRGDPPEYASDQDVVPSRDATIHPIPVSRERWLKAMVNGIDLLTRSELEAWAPPAAGHFSGSFGALGKKTDLVGPRQLDKGAILELREVSKDMDYRDWHAFARDVFAYIMMLNAYDPAGGAAAPQYTKRSLGGRPVR